MLRHERLQAAVRMVWHRALGTGVGILCMSLPGRSGSLRSSWRVREPSLCSSAPEPSIRSGLGQEMDRSQDRRSGRGGDSRCRTGILSRHYCRGAEPKDGCNLLAFTPHLLTQPPCRPAVCHHWDSFSCAQHSRQCDRDPLGRHSMSWPGQAAVRPSSKCDRYLVQRCARRDLHFELHF